MKDYYHRVEFQNRGSPHIHMFLWIDNSPIFIENDIKTEKDIISFIDKYISTEKNINEGDNVVDYQIHKHSKSCRRKIKGENICRFNIPFPPMKETRILYPNGKSKITKNNYDKIRSLLNSKDLSGMENFDNLLSRLEMTEEEYINAIQSCLK